MQEYNKKEKAPYISIIVSIILLILLFILRMQFKDCSKEEHPEMNCSYINFGILVVYVWPCYFFSVIASIVSRAKLSNQLKSPENKNRKDLRCLSIINKTILIILAILFLVCGAIPLVAGIINSNTYVDSSLMKR